MPPLGWRRRATSSRTVRLESGGTLELRCDVGILGLSRREADLVGKIVDFIDEFERRPAEDPPGSLSPGPCCPGSPDDERGPE